MLWNVFEALAALAVILSILGYALIEQIAACGLQLPDVIV
jgi:hypothetical protein